MAAPWRAQLGPDFRGRVPDPIGSAFWVELHRLGESIQAAGGLDVSNEANMHVVQMNPGHSDWRAMVLESTSFDIERASCGLTLCSGRRGSLRLSSSARRERTSGETAATEA